MYHDRVVKVDSQFNGCKMNPVITVKNLRKRFVLHLQEGLHLSVLHRIDLSVEPGECVALVGSSGAGKSTFLRLIYGNYKAEEGSIRVRHGERWTDMVKAEPRQILDIRKQTIGYVSQFLRVIPRIPALDILTEPARVLGDPAEEARLKAEQLLTRLRIPGRLWRISPTTFSGGEQQRINIARSFIVPYPILLLDEPTAALDASNRETVIELIQEAKARGTAILGVFHDEEVRDAVATRVFEMIAEDGKA
jgi:alpha-D-ribose 1-methylphosphonate 5-triphosphate synthase subunit PhnL